MEIEPIAHFRSPFPDKFGIPRQAGLSPSVRGQIVFEPGFRSADAVRGLEGFDYIWLIWGFSENEDKEWSPSVRPPRLGGNTRKGVFATRSPFRPNNLGLSLVKLEKMDKDKMTICVSGVDMLDGSPIYDIKPYLPYAECCADAIGGFTESVKDHRLSVVVPDEVSRLFTCEEIDAIVGIISQDPRPAYQDDESRVYGFLFKDYNIRFSVSGNIARVEDAEKIGKI